MKKLLITGAGVDRTSGIDFPLANTLLPEIATFAKNEGKELDDSLRKTIPNLRFNFSNLISRAIENITTREVHEQRALIERLNNAINALTGDPKDEMVKKHGTLLIKLFDKLATVAENASLDAEITDLIKDVFGDKAEEYLESDSILDINKMSLSDTFKQVLKHTLRLSLNKEHHKIANALGADMLNIENLLIEKFLGFYNNKLAEIKNYIYISWMMWAYLVDREKRVMKEHTTETMPFYSKIPIGYRAITLNYTSFLEKQLGKENVIYFHGGLGEYVRMDRRELNEIENFSELETITFFEEEIKYNTLVSDNIDEQQKHIIPALVPPLKLKPILSSRYIDIWYKASEWIKEADTIVVIGYSFNTADEHFNDIIRKNRAGKSIYIIMPDAHTDYSLKNFHLLFGVSPKDWTSTKKLNKETKRHDTIYLIAAKADEVDISQL